MGRVRELPGRQGLYVEFWHPAQKRNVRFRFRGTRREAERFLRDLLAQADRERAGLAPSASNDVEIADLIRAWRAYNSGRTRPRT